jgi:hypothetical protein
MDKRRLLIRFLPVGIAGLVILFQFISAEKVTNEAGRTARYALSSREEETLGVRSYQQV